MYGCSATSGSMRLTGKCGCLRKRCCPPSSGRRQKPRVEILCPVTQSLTVDFAGRSLRQLREKLDLPGVFMLTELCLHECLDVRLRVRGGRRSDDVGLDDLAAQGVWHPDYGCFRDQGM